MEDADGRWFFDILANPEWNDAGSFERSFCTSYSRRIVVVSMVVGEANDFAFQCGKIIQGFFRTAEGVAERGLGARPERANIHRAFAAYQRRIESANCLDKRPGHFRPSLRAD